VPGGREFQPRQNPTHPFPKINQRDEVALDERIGLFSLTDFPFKPVECVSPSPQASKSKPEVS
jgi:hypothetical protein